MKYVFVALLTLLVVISACSSSENEKTEENESVVSPVNSSDEELNTSDKVVVENLQPVLAEIPKGSEINIQINKLELSRPFFDKDQEYELKFFTNTLDDIASFSVCFTPVCGKDPAAMFLSVNDVLVNSEEINCKQESCVDLAKSNFNNGPNVILFQSQVKEDYYVEDVVLSYNLVNGSSTHFDGEDFLLSYVGSTEAEFDELGTVSLRSVQTRTFTLREKDTYFDITLTADLSENTGTLQILFNGQELYSGNPKKDVELVLPQKDLVVGTNELVFIGS